jgi:hypothetical protein
MKTNRAETIQCHFSGNRVGNRRATEIEAEKSVAATKKICFRYCCRYCCRIFTLIFNKKHTCGNKGNRNLHKNIKSQLAYLTRVGAYAKRVFI